MKCAFALVLLFLWSCASPSGSGSSDSGDAGFHNINRLIVANLQVRRPAFPSADPKADPYQSDYRTALDSNDKYSCQPWRELFSEVNLARLRSCIKSLKTDTHVLYQLVREVQPSLQLKDWEKAPQCLVDVLPKIAVPREIIFQSNEEGALGCYSARIDPEADEVFGVKLPIEKVGVGLTFPLMDEIDSDEDLRLVLLSWVLTPFMTPHFAGRLLPEALCVRCMGEKLFLRDGDAPPSLWPK